MYILKNCALFHNTCYCVRARKAVLLQRFLVKCKNDKEK